MGSRWRTDPAGPYIRLRSGSKFYFLHPDFSQIPLSDLVHNLAGTNRYTGSSAISVAQHCVSAAVFACTVYGDLELAKGMLVHDLGESVMGDVSAPLKSLLPEYKALERAVDLEVERRFGVQFLKHPLFKEVDDRTWLTELPWVYWSHFNYRQDYDGELEPFQVPPGAVLCGWSRDVAAKNWFRAHQRLFIRNKPITWSHLCTSSY